MRNTSREPSVSWLGVQHRGIPSVPRYGYQVYGGFFYMLREEAERPHSRLLMFLRAVQVCAVCYFHTATPLFLRKSLMRLSIDLRVSTDALKLSALSSS